MKPHFPQIQRVGATKIRSCWFLIGVAGKAEKSRCNNRKSFLSLTRINIIQQVISEDSLVRAKWMSKKKHIHMYDMTPKVWCSQILVIISNIWFLGLTPCMSSCKTRLLSVLPWRFPLRRCWEKLGYLPQAAVMNASLSTGKCSQTPDFMIFYHTFPLSLALPSLLAC